MGEKAQKKPAPAAAAPQGPLLALVFALGAQTMIVELSLPRLLAPSFGNTLFCWTAAIGVVLAALAAGYHAGGVLSARKPAALAAALPWRLAAAASVWVALSGLLGDRIVGALSGLGLIAGPLIGTLLLAAPAAAIGASVLPLGVALTSQPAGAGRSAGRLYACSTVGSVLGVLLTGYLLLPLLGIAGALYTAAGLVFAAFFAAKRVLIGTAGLGGVILLAAAAGGDRSAGLLLDRSNGYHRIRVVSSREDPRVRRLYLDSTIEGMTRLGSREASAVVEVAEIDPDVVAAARRFLELPPNLDVAVGDARRILKESGGQYDLIVNDAFHGVRKIPFHLVTREFNRLVAQRLTARGIYAVNVLGHRLESRLVRSVTATLRQDFRHVHHFTFMQADVQNIWVLAGAQPLPIGEPAPPSAEAGMIFTDNHAPVEFLIALDVRREAGRGEYPR